MIARLVAFLWGMVEFRSMVTRSYDPVTDAGRHDAYDQGRDLAHRLTLRRLEP
jgi:hypothetical protein